MPIWIAKAVVIRIHDEQLRRHGGDAGILDEGRLEAAIERPRNIHAYLDGSSLEELAAALAVGLAKNHPFVDGNKRTAQVTSLLFLRLNGIEIAASESELGDIFIAVAAGAMPERELAEWFAESSLQSE